MSLKKSLLIVGTVIALLLPAGVMLRSQNPWNCFPFTFDESYFAEAAYNWSEGRGYRLTEQAKPFDPTITVGIPMAWGATAIHKWSGEDIAHSGRMFVYFCFVLLFISIAVRSYWREKNWIAVPIALCLFALGASKIPIGNYFVFGFLGEGPALLLGSLAYMAIDRKRYFLAGVLSVGVFLMKPTFIFFPAAVGLASLRSSFRSAVFSGAGGLGMLGAAIIYIASARDQSLQGYLIDFYNAARAISENDPTKNIFDLYLELNPLTAIFSVGFIVSGIWALRGKGKLKPNAALDAAFLLFGINVLYFLISRRQPVEKQWAAIFCLTLAGFSVSWANAIARRLYAWIPQDLFRAVTISIMLTYVLAVGQNAHHRFKRLSEHSCNSKEQSAINVKILELIANGEVKKGNLSVLVEDHPLINFLYRIGWQPETGNTWEKLGTPHPEWVAGETSLIFPAPAGCTEYWKGDSFSIAQCARK